MSQDNKIRTVQSDVNTIDDRVTNADIDENDYRALEDRLGDNDAMISGLMTQIAATSSALTQNKNSI